jgi:uncharacterized protein (TIGR02268 family)
MPALPPTAALSLLLLSSAPVLAQPATTSWEMTGAPRFTVTADSALERREVRIRSGLGILFVFDTPVQRGGVVVEAREHFRQVSLSEDGLMLTLLPSGELPLGKRLTLTVRFADGTTPTSLDFTLVVSPQAEPQVEVYRRPRPGDSFRLEAEEAEEKLQRCETERARERAERDAPPGLMGLLALKQMGDEGIRSKVITREVSLRPGETFEVVRAVSYRAVGDTEAPVVRLAVKLSLRSLGTRPWTPAHAELVGQGGRWKVEVWPPEPLAPGATLDVLVEVELAQSAARGPYLLKLWDESGTRMASLSGVTFP